MPRLGRAFVSAASLVVGCTIASTARAQAEEPEPQAETVSTARGPISGSTRYIGLAGAFVAIADDSEGVAINPASVAVRLPYSWSAWDHGVGVDISIGAWLPKSDSYNRADAEDVSESSALFGSLAATLNYNHAGAGVSAEAQSNAASRQDQEQGITSNLGANFGMVHVALAYGFMDGQLLFGGGPRIVGMSFDRHNSESGALSSAGTGYEAGVVIKPKIAQYRIGAAVKSAIDAKVPGSRSSPSGSMHVPWEVSLGFAYQFGVRPLNPPFMTAERVADLRAAPRKPTDAEVDLAEDELFARYQRLQRRYLLISAELSISEADGNNLGLGQYWSNSEAAAGDKPLFSPRLGLETEVVRHVLRLRGGSYYEPARYEGARSRVHGTAGLDVRLFKWNVFGLIGRFDYWQLSLAADAARAYLNTSFSIGFWH
jgi:hypothetical protein